TYLKASELDKATDWKELTVKSLHDIRSQVNSTESMRGVEQYGAIATGYVEIPEDGVYYFSSNNDEVWIDGKRLINNEGEVKRFSRHDASMALAKGLHEIKVVFLGHIIGGWPSLWDSANISIRKADQEKFVPIKPEQLFY
ncbi:MAG: beta-hexosaminidase, partial [Phocaeicola sp.]|nr:beta-hexosaminidase [Phocaeicola sp.]